MKKKLKINYTRKEIIDLIYSAGWTLERTGKHYVYGKENIREKIIISHSNEVSCGVARKILALLDGSYYGGNNRFSSI